MLLLIFFAGGKKFAQNYMLARELGSGAFSVVKLAMHLVCFFLPPVSFVVLQILVVFVL
jgi:hypothetical protein